MRQPSALIWMVLIFLLILPTPAGKLFLDFAGGIFLIIALIPVVLGGIGWIALQKIKSKIETCEFCGSNFLNNQNVCPICGKSVRNMKNDLENIPASAATIDIQSEKTD